MRDDTAGSWKLRPPLAKPPAAVGWSPVRGLCKRSLQRPVAGRSVRLPPTDDGRGRKALAQDTAGSWKLRPPLAKPRGAVGRSPRRGLCKRSPQLLVAGRSVQFPPTDAGRGRGRWAPTRSAVENCGLRGAKPPGAVQCSPREGAWQAKPATSSCRAFCAAFIHGRWPRPRGNGARDGQQLETAAFDGAKPPRRFTTSPREGGWQTKPATSSCRAFRAASTHERWARPRDDGP